MLELKHLKTIQALAQKGSVNKAADALFMTQSALSHQIKQLESTFELKLFERKSNPLTLTSAGKTLLKTAQEVLPKLAQAEATLQAFAKGEQGRLFIGVECHTCFEWLLPMVRRYQQIWMDVDLDITNSLNKSALQNLIEKKLDLVITSDPIENDELAYHSLFGFELRLLVPVNHSLANKQWVEPKDLVTETLICYPVSEGKLDVFKRFLNPEGFKPKTIRHSEMTMMMLQLVESQRGVCVLPKWLVDSQPEFAHLPTLKLGKDGLWSTLYAATHVDSESQPYIADFIDKMASKIEKRG
ncbi:MAG: LysR family transcriptional regulator, regulator for metE and metH [Thiomicrorhabdus sp.]|nr:MAG: LysR family transcriptional regulator, regulator for metE and metH [Thiomicrorhabdus sp.]